MATKEQYAEYIRNKVSQRTVFEQLAEEASELTQASLKIIRAAELSDDSPTNITQDEAVHNLAEEIHDVFVCLYIIGCVEIEDNVAIEKLKRWAERLGYKDE